MLDALTAALLHHNGYVLPFSLHSSLLTTAMDRRLPSLVSSSASNAPALTVA